MTEPHPGSAEARERGCTCAVIDNHYGRGRNGDGETWGWWMSSDCPLHGSALPAYERVARPTGER